MNRTTLAVAATAALTTTALYAAPAQAGPGDFESGVYWDALGGVRQVTIQNRCGCTPNADNPIDARHKDEVYVADNGSFAWDICWISIHFEKNADGQWVARNYDNGSGGKERIGCAGTGQYQDGINAT